MPRRPARRLTAVLLMAVSLLFSQLALAAYACPGQADAAMARMMAPGERCEGMDPGQPVLCHQHASGATQSFEAPTVAAPTLPLLVHMVVLPLVPEAAATQAAAVAARPDARPPPDPIFLATLRLRV